jgi:two-component system chemotaxis response regulator CheY
MSEKKRVLIADDSKVMRESLKTILEKCHCEVVGMAENGAQVISQYKDLKPDLITLDIVMPQLNGIDTLKTLKSIHAEVKVIMVTSLATQQDVIKCKDLGANYYILKPFEDSKVIETIKMVTT